MLITALGVFVRNATAAYFDALIVYGLAVHGSEP